METPCVVWSPGVGGTGRALGRPRSSGQVGACGHRSHCNRMCGEMGLSQAYMRSSQIPELSKIWSLFFHDQTEIGPCGWRFVGVRGKLESVWAQGLPGYSRGYSGQFHVLPVTQACMWVSLRLCVGVEAEMRNIHVLLLNIVFILRCCGPIPIPYSDLEPTPKGPLLVGVLTDTESK